MSMMLCSCGSRRSLSLILLVKQQEGDGEKPMEAGYDQSFSLHVNITPNRWEDSSIQATRSDAYGQQQSSMLELFA